MPRPGSISPTSFSSIRPSTGYSHIVATGDNVRRQFLSVDGDADALAVVIRKWIEKNGRQASAKFLVGESYGGFRVPKVARTLSSSQGVGRARADHGTPGARLRQFRPAPPQPAGVGDAAALDGGDRSSRPRRRSTATRCAKS